MPTILFDQQIFTLQRFGGISRYFSELIHLLGKSKGYRVLPGNYFSNNLHLNYGHINKFSILYRVRRFTGKGRLINYIAKNKAEQLNKILREGRFDIFHPTYYGTDFLNYLPSDKPLVLTVYDMIHEKYCGPDFESVYDEMKNKASLIPKAAHIIAISNHTKNDILSLYPAIEPSKVSVIHLGYTPSKMNKKKDQIVDSRYILFVGSRWTYKNFEWMLRSLADFLKEKDFHLICAGGGNFTHQERTLIHDLKVESQVRFYDIPNDGYLNNLYRNAFCFIFPSLYEGFGLPILEAFANECPVILANATCFPEIGDKGALYFDVDSAQSLIANLNNLLDETHRIDIIKAGSKRLENFSWEKMVAEHKKIYTSILRS